MKTSAKHLLLLALMGLLLAPLLTSCGTDDESDAMPASNSQEDFEEFLLDEMDFQEIPAMAILVFKDDQVLYEKYLGQSNREQSTALATNDLFLMASISKTITATALMQLYDQGLFELDDPINDYLDFEVNVPGETTAITFRMLLTHTSGIADGSALDDQYFYGEDSPLALATFLEGYLVPGGTYYNASENFYDFEPGTEHEYSNEGSALIGVLVEELSGTNFNSYCKQNIFQPLGMNNTFWRLDEINQTIVTPYDYDGQWTKHEHYTFTDYPNGGLRSTVRDMHQLATAMLQGGQANGHQLLQASTVDRMLRPQISDIDNQVGLHYFVMNQANNLWGHDGGEQGVATIMGWNKETGTGAIILTNQGEADLDNVLTQAYLFGQAQ